MEGARKVVTRQRLWHSRATGALHENSARLLMDAGAVRPWDAILAGSRGASGLDGCAPPRRCARGTAGGIPDTERAARDSGSRPFRGPPDRLLGTAIP